MIRFVPGAERLGELVCVMRRSWPTTNGSITGWANWDSTAYRRKAPPSETKQLRRISPLRSLPRWSSDGHRQIETIEPMIANKRVFELAQMSCISCR